MMEQTKHTPGPWEVDSLDGCIYGRVHTCVAVPHAGAGLYINTKPIEDANAALIAAAPELLEALQAVYSCMIYPPCDSCNSQLAVDGKTINKIEAAIAKAT